MISGKRKRKNEKTNSKKYCKLSTKEKAKEEFEANYFIPVVFYNLKSYDSHFVTKHFKKQYTERDNGEDKAQTYDDVNVTPINSEKYIMFEIGKLRFIDSFQFLSTSLENLVSILLKSGKDNFEHTRKYLGDNEMVFAKGVYPYSYMSSREKFDETELPSIESFHVTLNDEPLPPEDYERAKAIWKHFDIGNMRQYHDHYLIFYLTFFCLRMFSKIFEIPSWLNTNSTAYIT